MLLDRLKEKQVREHEAKLLDDLVPGHHEFPIHKLVKLVEPEYTAMKIEKEFVPGLMADFNLDEGPEDPQRLVELRKLAVEVDRNFLINKQLQKLKMEQIYGPCSLKDLESLWN